MKNIKLLLLLVLFTVYSSAALALPSKYNGGGKGDWRKTFDNDRIQTYLIVKSRPIIKFDDGVKFNILPAFGTRWDLEDKQMNKWVAQWPHDMEMKKWSHKKKMKKWPQKKMKKWSNDKPHEVPEPGMVGLLAIGLLGMVAVRRRLRHK